MQIYGPFRVSATPSPMSTQRVQAPRTGDVSAKTSAGPIDQLDLTNSASSINRLQGTAEIAGNGEIRIDRVAEIRRQIANGSYETAEKLDAALDRLLDQFA
jgi:anti-sigma28 factor (negative regulator of flagellin synthesis)